MDTTQSSNFPPVSIVTCTPAMAEKVLTSPLVLAEQLTEARAALAALHRICRDCDLENQATTQPPTEDQYAEAMDAAEACLRGEPPPQSRQVRQADVRGDEAMRRAKERPPAPAIVALDDAMHRLVACGTGKGRKVP